MPFVEWTERLSVGVTSIDDQHKKLVSLINQLHDGMLSGKGREILSSVLKGLIDYTTTHFKYEEDIFVRTGYPDAAAHKAAHADLVRQVKEIERKLDQAGPATLTIKTMNFLKDWLTSHIQGEDKRYSPHFAAKGVR